jgi:hypothetical protein
VRERLTNVPWWRRSLVKGALFGVLMTVVFHVRSSGGWTGDIIGGLILGVFMGAVLEPIARRQRRKVSAVASDLPARDLRVARRAVNHGPVPTDPNIRQAAARLAALQLNELSRFRWLGLIVSASLTVFSAYGALTSSPWYWIPTAVAAALLAIFLMGPGLVGRRIEMLRQETVK